MSAARRTARIWVLAFALGLLLVGGAAWSLHVLSDSRAEPRVAPDFTLETVHHGNFTLSEHRGDIVVLDLMAVECPTCRVTEQSMLRLAAEHPEVVILSVDIWTHVEDEAYLDAHLQGLGADWPYAMDTDGLLFKYDAYVISKVVVIDADGHIAWEASGAIRYAQVDAAVQAASQGEAILGFAPSLSAGIFVFAILAGAISFFAPCAFPLLPGYMAYTLNLGTGNVQERGMERRPRRSWWRVAVAPGIAAAVGIVLVYGLFGLLVAALGETARPWLRFIQPSVGVVAVVLGIALLLGASMTRIIAPLQHGVDRLVGAITRRNTPGTLTGYFSYGVGYGAAAAGCTAPIFLQLAFTAFVLGFGTGLRVFLVYAGTAALLMVLATFIAVAARERLQRHSARIATVANRVSGVVLVLAGLYLVWFYHRAFGLPFL